MRSLAALLALGLYPLILAQTPTQTPYIPPVDPGFWTLNITNIRSAQGFESMAVWAVHSAHPEKVMYDYWEFLGQNTTSIRTDRRFQYELKGICGVGQMVVVKQAADIGGRDVWITGSADVAFKVNTVTGRGGTANGIRVNATFDNGAVDVCGRPLNRDPNA
ncbi:hypothetical protein B0T16DRAFT_448283 [Cercophora newfieldiana]|uniref:Uncharacterized protein n=1 Tax=Cercophora newfieldiana TaxID=92897 RepID=A0AA39XUQ4_9PEZI|nr:hypothetical protein B0T16DRAFT_448283 [Cercophora newfieldiana]